MAIEARSRVPSAAANGKHGHTLISNEKFRQLYTLALELRLLAHRSAPQAMPGTAGDEAAVAGVAADLQADDVLLAQEHVGIETLRGILPGGLRELLPETHDFSERLVATISGAAADRLRKNRTVAAIFVPADADASLLKDAWALASAARLPALFVERGGGETSSYGSGMPPIPVDANDVVAIYRVAHESIARAREGSGPTRIHCIPWRPAARVRKRQSVGSADAIEHLEEWLTARGLPAQEWRQEIVAGFKQRAGETAAGDGLNEPREPVPNGWSGVEGAISQQSM